MFLIDGEKFTQLKYGKFMLEKTFSESNGATLDPKSMTVKEISEWGLQFILEQMNEREDIKEIECRLTPVNYALKRFATDEELKNQSYIVKDGMITFSQLRYTVLIENYRITLEEAKVIYEKILAIVNLREGEEITNLKFDLTTYTAYEQNGEPKYASEEYPINSYDVKRYATYSHKRNKLMIWENGLPIYENYDGEICEDRDALADSYL